jgi:hypothetical protein
MHQLSKPPTRPPDPKVFLWLAIVLVVCVVIDTICQIYRILV